MAEDAAQRWSALGISKVLVISSTTHSNAEKHLLPTMNVNSAAVDKLESSSKSKASPQQGWNNALAREAEVCPVSINSALA